jgi:osmotically-inducible protein OsmY
VDAALVDVSVDDGEVDLEGFVGSAAQKDRAITNAWVAGVQSVNARDLAIRWWARDEMRRTSRDIPDERIQNAVRDALLFNIQVPAAEVSVDVDNGVVDLQGKVQALRAKQAAERSARNTAGVIYVVNRIKVRPDEVPADPVLKERVIDALERDPWGWDEDINVHVSNGEVSLYGQVDSDFERSWLATVAAGVEGVVALNNFLVVREEYPTTTDAEIRATLNELLAWDPEVNVNNVSAIVQDGTVTLEGTVTDFAALDAAVDNAWLAGARSVVNDLAIEGMGEVYEQQQ